jgi:hypothetical protein
LRTYIKEVGRYGGTSRNNSRTEGREYAIINGVVSDLISAAMAELEGATAVQQSGKK